MCQALSQTLRMHFFVPGPYNHPVGSREESEPLRGVVWLVNTTSRCGLCLHWLTVELTLLPALTTFIAFSLGLVALNVPTVPHPQHGTSPHLVEDT